MVYAISNNAKNQHVISIHADSAASDKWKLKKIEIFNDRGDTNGRSSGYPSISSIKFRIKSSPYIHIQVPTIVVNPQIVLNANIQVGFEIWIGTTIGTSVSELDWSGNDPYNEAYSTDLIKCGFTFETTNSQQTIQCNGQGSHIFVRNTNGNSESMYIKEVRVLTLRTKTLGVWCLPISETETTKSGVTWWVSGGEIGNDDDDDVRDWQNKGNALNAAFGTIQHAINQAENGDVVRLGAGIYTTTTTASNSKSTMRCGMNMLPNPGAEEDTNVWSTGSSCTRVTDIGASHSGSGSWECSMDQTKDDLGNGVSFNISCFFVRLF